MYTSKISNPISTRISTRISTPTSTLLVPLANILLMTLQRNSLVTKNHILATPRPGMVYTQGTFFKVKNFHG